ncbi:MAG TPA: hypothetical protein VNW04_14225 [Puia sp.]|nr:hypothetical protein [Puia sp.]
MAKYCLTFDAKDALAWEPEELKMEVSRLLMENGGSYLESPIVNVVLFEDGKDRSDLQSWNHLLLKSLKEDIYYYLCVVPQTKDGDFFERNEGDPDLNDDYQQLLEDLQSE